MASSANRQIQGIPTPILYVRNRFTGKQDNVYSEIQLSLFGAIYQQNVNQTDTGTAAVSLANFVTNGKQQVWVYDYDAASLLLSNFVAVLAQTAPAQIETGAGNLALTNFVAVLAQTAPTQIETGAGNLALTNFVI